jgi:enoyl-CoA hydratase/carnithine racemase
MPDYPHLLVETTADGVRTITLDRADKLNAVNGALAASFPAAVADAAAADAVRVVVVTGAGRAFCAGLDLSEPPTLPSATRVERLEGARDPRLREARHRGGERTRRRSRVRSGTRV